MANLESLLGILRRAIAFPILARLIDLGRDSTAIERLEDRFIKDTPKREQIKSARDSKRQGGTTIAFHWPVSSSL